MSEPSRPTHRLVLATGEMLRAGRAMARIEQAELANAAGVSLETIKRLERIRGAVNANVRTMRALTRAFSSFGVEFFQDADGRCCVCLETGERGEHHAEVPHPRREPVVIYRALYYSTAASQTRLEARTVLDNILSTASVVNARLGVTGALLGANGRFMQVLEGPKTNVLRLLGAIAMDPRHSDFTPIECRAAPGRRFGDWLMAARLFDADGSDESGDLKHFAPESLTPEAALDLLGDVSRRERAALS